MWGVGCLLWALHLAVIVVLDLRATNFFASNVLHLNSYYLCGTLIGVGAIMLLRPNDSYKNSDLMRERLVHMITYSTTSIVTIILFSGTEIEEGVIILLSVLLVIEMMLLLISFLKNYRNTVAKLDNIYVEEAKESIIGMKRAIWIAYFCVITTPFSLYAPEWAISLYALVTIPCVFLLYLSFQNFRQYLIILSEIENTPVLIRVEHPVIIRENTPRVIRIDSPAPAQKSREQAYIEDVEKSLDEEKQKKRRTRLKEDIEIWIESRGFTDKNLTIIDLSKALNTNRTYLTEFINTEYQQTFREWMIELRIGYAKQLLTSNPHITVTEVATEIGYSSASYFAKRFTESTNMTPKQWQVIAAKQARKRVFAGHKSN